MGQSLMNLEPPPDGCAAANPAEPDDVSLRARPKRRLPPGPYAKTSSDGHSVDVAARPPPLPKALPPARPPVPKKAGSPVPGDEVPLIRLEPGLSAKACIAAACHGGRISKAATAIAKGPPAASNTISAAAVPGGGASAKATPAMVSVSQSEGYAGLFCYDVCLLFFLVDD